MLKVTIPVGFMESEPEAISFWQRYQERDRHPCHSREGGNPFGLSKSTWLPAFAGMTIDY